MDLSLTSLECLWSMDHLGIRPKELGAKEIDVLCDFENSIEYSQQDKQYIVSLPWKTDKSVLPTNFSLAYRRFVWLQKRFQADSAFCRNYSAVISDQLQRGFIERVHEVRPKID